MSCTAPLSSAALGTTFGVPVIAMEKRIFAVTGDHVVTTCGFVTLANAGDSHGTGQWKAA